MRGKASYWGAVAGCSALIAAGFICHGVIAVSNFIQGLSLTDDPTGKWIYAVGALAIDAVGMALFSWYAGKLWRQNEKPSAVAYGIVSYVAVAFSVLMFYGFAAVHRIEPARVASAQFSSYETARLKAEAKAETDQEKHLQFLRGLAASANKAALDKRADSEDRSAARGQTQTILDDLAAKSGFGSIKIEAAPVERSADPQAAALAADTGWTVEKVQKTTTIGFVVLILIIGNMAVSGGARSFPRWADYVEEAPAQPVAEAPMVATLAEPAPRELEAPAIDAALGPATPEDDAERDADINSLASDLFGEAREEMQTRAAVAEYIATQTVTAPDEMIEASALFRNYCKWAESRNYRAINGIEFGKAMTSLNDAGAINFPRLKGRVNKYIGRMPRFADGKFVEARPTAVAA
jgi:hypothetical protein